MKNIIENKLRKINRISFHVPGHKNGHIYKKYHKKDILKIDTTEIPGTDDLFNPEGIIKESQDRASKFFGSDNTFFLVNGTTSGNMAAIMAVLNPGDKILIPRNCHKSVINGIILAGAKPIYLMPKLHKNVYMGINLIELENKLQEHGDIKVLLITNPSYFGICVNVKKISQIAHKYGLILIVDEAHGSHLILNNELPENSLKSGADIVCQSTHKTLFSFTQSSMLHVKGSRVDISKLKFMLSILQSTSPSYLLMDSLDTSVSILLSDGKKLMNNLIENLKEFYFKLENMHIEHFNKEYLKKYGVYDYDITRIVIDMTNYGIVGKQLEEILYKEYNIQVEMSTPNFIVAVATMANTKDDFNALYEALISIKNKYSKERVDNKEIEFNIDVKSVITPREAVYSNKRDILLEKSMGCISGDYVTPYPPGIPIIVPGEEISKDILEYIMYLRDNNVNITGMKDSSMKFIQVIDG